MNDGKIALVLNTPSGKGARTDEGRIRAAAVQLGIPCITTLQAAEAAVKAMEALRGEDMGVQALQERFPRTQGEEAWRDQPAVV
jgi:carbamoyl-phosphate synthase large subunit